MLFFFVYDIINAMVLVAQQTAKETVIEKLLYKTWSLQRAQECATRAAKAFLLCKIIF